MPGLCCFLRATLPHTLSPTQRCMATKLRGASSSSLPPQARRTRKLLPVRAIRSCLGSRLAPCVATGVPADAGPPVALDSCVKRKCTTSMSPSCRNNHFSVSFACGTLYNDLHGRQCLRRDVPACLPPLQAGVLKGPEEFLPAFLRLTFPDGRAGLALLPFPHCRCTKMFPGHLMLVRSPASAAPASTCRRIRAPVLTACSGMAPVPATAAVQCTHSTCAISGHG